VQGRLKGCLATLRGNSKASLESDLESANRSYNQNTGIRNKRVASKMIHK